MTRIVLANLIEAGIKVRLVCLPGRRTLPLLKTGRRRALPMAGPATTPRTVAEVARSAEIDLWRIGDFDAPEVHEEVAAVAADLVVVSCYHRLIPDAIYAGRAYGGVNLHPSLLPDKRGPDPLFWVFREDDARVGATVHRLTDRYDAGDILMQASMEKPDGISEDELDAHLAHLGSQLLLQSIAGMADDDIAPNAQQERDKTWAPQPRPEDYRLDRAWPARHAVNFVRGVGGRGYPLLVERAGQTVQIREILDWPTGERPPPDVPEDAAMLRFADGWVVARVSPPEP